jgi:hypothetical protein
MEKHASYPAITRCIVRRVSDLAVRHALVMQWAYALTVQVDRVHADRLAFMESAERVRQTRFYGHEHAKAPRLMNADSHLCLVAANQLIKALEAFDDDLRLHPGVTREHLTLLRNALEHWEDENGHAQRGMAALGADANSNKWRVDGSGLLGDIVDDLAMRAWAQHVYDDLVDYDPPSPVVRG